MGYGIQVNLLTIADERYFHEEFSFQETDLRQWDFGLDLGLGLEKDIGNRYKLFLEFRHFLGLWNIVDTQSQETFNDGSVVDLGILFLLNKNH